MAFFSCRLACRKSLSSIRSALRSNVPKSPSAATSAHPSSSLPSRTPSSACPRFSFSRMPAELGCVQSMLPLHDAVAAARMTSRLSTTSRSCRALSQARSFSPKVTGWGGFRSGKEVTFTSYETQH